MARGGRGTSLALPDEGARWESGGAATGRTDRIARAAVASPVQPLRHFVLEFSGGTSLPVKGRFTDIQVESVVANTRDGLEIRA